MVNGSGVWYAALLWLAFVSETHSKSISPRQWLPAKLKNGGSNKKPSSFNQFSRISSAASKSVKVNTKQEQLYEAYNMLHSLAQVRL